MILQKSIKLNGLTEEPYPLLEIKEAFEYLADGGELIIEVPHRDLYFGEGITLKESGHKFFMLPELCEPPHTFSLKHVIQQALNSVCMELPKEFDKYSDELADSLEGREDKELIIADIRENQKKAFEKMTEGQGAWQLIDLHIEENHIIALIKKI